MGRKNVVSSQYDYVSNWSSNSWFRWQWLKEYQNIRFISKKMGRIISRSLTWVIKNKNENKITNCTYRKLKINIKYEMEGKRKMEIKLLKTKK